MQLGTRWSVGSPAPDRVPPQVVDAIAIVEADLGDIDTSQWRWTLTWLEGKPTVELDDGTIIRFDGAEAAIFPPEDTED